jgi:SPP1 family phage portal protein
MQANTVLLGNGITWEKGIGAETLGSDFDRKVMKAGRIAQVEGEAFGFFNNGKVEVYGYTEYAPLYDEEDGFLKAGARFWQIDSNKPLRATMMELDGYTEYQYDKDHPDGFVRAEKRPYITIKEVTPALGEEIGGYQNYPTFPVVPCWANEFKRSELLPIRSTIDAFDLISCKFANNVSDAALIYWTITNSGGMDDESLATFLDKMRKLHAANLDADQQVQANSVDVPHESMETILDRLEDQLYKDSMSLNVNEIASGAVTATQIEAAYEPLNEKLDGYEAEITDFIYRLLKVAGVEDKPTYTRSIMVNQTETINAVMNSATVLDPEYMTEKIMTILGDKDKVEQVLDRQAEANVNRMMNGNANTQTE